MFPNRTSKRTAPRVFVGVICIAALVAGAQALAAPQIRMRLESTSPVRGRGPTRISLYGRAAVHCKPTLERVTLDGLDLNIELANPETACDDRYPVPFALRVDPSRSTGLPILPGQVYRVRVYARTGNSTSLVAFQLLDTHSLDSASIPENGFWWPESAPGNAARSYGQGASMEWQDGLLAVSLFGFSDAGTPTWYFGSTRPHGRVAEISLVQLTNGDPLFAQGGTQPAAQAGPRLHLEFLSPARTRAWLVRGEEGRSIDVRTLVLSRSRFTTDVVGSTWSGQWVLVADEKSVPRRFEFADASSRDAQSFHLADTGNDASLDCRTDGANGFPDLCTLSVAAVPLADFDSIGVDHLGGRDSGGAHVTLMRVPR